MITASNPNPGVTAHTEKITEITAAKWSTRPVSVFNASIRRARRTLTRSASSEKRLLEKELGLLMKAHKGFHLSTASFGAGEIIPVLGGVVAALRTISEETVIMAVSRVAAVRYITSMDIDSLVWQAKYCVIVNAIMNKDSEPHYGEKLGALTDLDTATVTRALNPLEQIFAGGQDELYKHGAVYGLSDDTRARYRRMTAEIAIAAGIDEAKLAREHLNRANSEGRHVGEVIYKDYRRVFPFMKLSAYLMWLMLPALTLTAVFAWIVHPLTALLVLLPCMAVFKPAADYIAVKVVRTCGLLPRIALSGGIPGKARTLCVVSTLITSQKDITCGFGKLKEAKLKNAGENITFCLLCDLKPAESENTSDDEKLLDFARSTFSGSEFAVLVRERRFSKTQNTYQGEERKRGAILALMKLLRDGDERRLGFRAVFGNRKALHGIKYMLALDYDTVPLMDSISELVSIALHPVNKNVGIIAPRITTSLDSYLKTGFSRAMNGNGGCAGASSYDSFSGEMYQDCFGEGIFTGKGLINVDKMLQAGDRFPPERILSHDILEGGCAGVRYAGDVEFSDGFPDTSVAFFKRQHRWLRGDLQNFRYCFDKGFSPLTRWKLFDNVRRAVTPLFAFLCFVVSVFISRRTGGGAWVALIGLAAIVMPFLTGFVPSVIRGRRFAFSRRFYSPVISQTKHLLRQCVLEIMYAPKAAVISADALCRVAWRMCVSKKHLLDWTTAAALEGFHGGFTHILFAEILSAALLAFAVINGNAVVFVLGVIFMCALPVTLYIDKTSGSPKPRMTKTMKNELHENARKMWAFYEDYVTGEHNHLPPDNIQYSPVMRTAARTSPTNIGMYLLSCVCARVMGFIDKPELERRVNDTLSTIEKLQKWHGNLFNWYETYGMNIISPFVSSVDSGNFVCCLVAVKQALIENGAGEELISRADSIARNTNLRPFYNKARNLFSIGHDTETGELSRHNYDLIMSEARMLSYYAVATGQAEKKHWRSLGRVMGRSGRYAAPVAWTGTMFEYYMPELLLGSKEGSMEYEALRFSLHCQQKRAREINLPFGMSESGYYAFDEALNYQYKAHGVQTVGLKAGLNKERVISPYSSFLTLGIDPIASYNNLVRLEKLGAVHPKYGFYEAVDFTKHRVGSGYAVVKSHMAHHVGMSMAGVCNALHDGKLQKLFLSDPDMKKAEELLEEKIMAGEPVLATPEWQEEQEYRMNSTEFTQFSPFDVHVNALSNGSLTVLTADMGVSMTLFGRKSAFYKTEDVLKPKGTLYAFAEGEHSYPFLNHPSAPAGGEKSVIFMQNSTEYYLNSRNLHMGQQVYLHPDKAVEIRRFAAENLTAMKRQLTLAVYLEPALARVRDIAAHPAFMDLFIKLRYDEEHRVIIVSRKERTGDAETVMAVGFRGNEDFTFSFNREEVIERNGGMLSAADKAHDRSIDTAGVPCPCVFVKADFPLDSFGRREAEFFVCYGSGEHEVLSLAADIRAGEAAAPCEEIISPLVRETMYGRFAARILPFVIYSPGPSAKAVMKNELSLRSLWGSGISGDVPIVLFDFFKGVNGADAVIEMKKALSLIGVEFDLVMLYESESQRMLAEQLKREINTDVFIVGKSSADPDFVNLLRAAACYTQRSDEIAPLTKKKLKEPSLLPVHRCRHPGRDNERLANRFEGANYIIEHSPELPWCNVLANPRFGCLVSDRSIGFTWALNSRENKLTPWNNDLRADNKGEMLVMNTGDTLYDLIDGSRAVFAPNRAEYHGHAHGVSVKTTVSVFEKGMGKELFIELENRSDEKKTFGLAYYTEPVLGVTRENAKLIKPEVRGDTLIFRNCSGGFSGVMLVYSDREAGFITNRQKFFEGDWTSAEAMPAYDLIGAAVIKIQLPPKHTDKIKFILAFTKNSKHPLTMRDALSGKRPAPLIEGRALKTGDRRLDALARYWLPWQIIGARIWARTGFYQNSGAFGYRDQLQDSLCAITIRPEITKRQIARACGAQFIEGDVLHWWHDTEMPQKPNKGVRTRYSDDLLWLPYVTAEYIALTKDYDLLETKVHYCEGDLLRENEHEMYIEVACSDYKESVYLHCKRALDKGYAKGGHELLLMGGGDWCDGYNEVGAEGKGETVWGSMFYVMVCKAFINTALMMGDADYADVLKARADGLTAAIDAFAWDGAETSGHYLRAFYDSGQPMGAAVNDRCKIDLLPQAFATLAQLPDGKRCQAALQAADEQLVDMRHRLIKLFTPPFARGTSRQKPGYVESYPEGVRENGGQYSHAAMWLALALYRAGKTERAEQLARMLAPFGRDEGYKTEPYYLAADIYTNPQAYGRGGWSIYTGSAGWYYKVLSEIFGEQK